MPELLICVDRKDFPADIPHPFYLPESSPVVICGSSEILKRPRLALLNSRQSPRLTKNSLWAQKTLEALRHYDPTAVVIVASLGTTAWDFLTWAAAKMGFSIILVYPAGSAQGFNVSRTKAILDLDLDERKTLALKPIRIGPRRTLEEDQALRDRWVLALSQEYAPVSVRPEGHLHTYIKHASLPDLAIDRGFQIRYKPPEPLKKPFVLKSDQIPIWFQPEEYLIHWTRSCIGPWPGETKADYFSRVMAGDEEVGGLETLRRILQEGVIRASSRLVRGGYAVVPFTERPPQDLPKMMRWRSGLRRWTFEPYGIALPKAKLLELGARPVTYGKIAEFERLAEGDRPFFQVAASGAGDWSQEKEWRIVGEVQLRLFASDRIAIFAPSAEEAGLLSQLYPCNVVALQ